MKTSKTSIWNRVLALALSVVLLVSMLPKGVVEAEEGTFGTVQGLTPGAVVEGSGAEVNVTYAEVELEWCDVDATQGRTKAGWYVGVRVLAPAGMTGQADFVTGENQVTFQTKGMSGWSETGMNFWENQNSDQNAADAERYIDLWYYLDEARLLTAKRSGGVNFGFRADWDIDGAYEQTVNVKLDPEKVVLKKEGSTVYPVTGLGSVSVLNSDGTINLTGGVIQGNGSDLVTVEMGQNTYVWVEKDTAAGRNTDGWWAGIRIDIPSNVSENASLKLGSGQTLLCADNYETDGAGKKYITLWKSLNKMPEEGKEISSEISFDWNADGVFEQVVEMKVDPAKTILEKDGKQVYPIQYVELTMAITGAGSVNIDEKTYRNGDKLSVEKGKELTIEVLADNANTRPVSMQVNGKDVDDLPAVYEENTTIAVNFITEYTITVETGEGGTVTGTGETAIKNNEVVVEAGKAATFQVQANEGYTISLIEVDGVAQSVEETAVTITPEKDLTLKAEFVKLYTINVECGENGEYKVTGDTFTADAANGNYVVKETTDGIVVEATPADTYRVESFLVNEDEQLDTPENDKGYQWTMTEVGDYTIEIAFALNRYTVEATNATIAAEHQEVAHGTEVTFAVKIPDDKNIDKILVNGIEVSPNLTEDEENPWEDTFTLTIVEKVNVEVVFKDVETNAAYKDLFNAEDAVTVIGEGSDQPIFVFKGDATVAFASENGAAWVKVKGKTYKKKNLSVQTNDVVIEELYVNYKMQKTQYTLPKNGIKLVFDNTVPEIKTDFDTDKIYNGDTVNVPFVVTDAEAGIATVSYQVGYYNAGVFQETQSGTPSVENGNYVVPVATNLNNRDDVIVKLTAEDKAVNSDTKEIKFNIDITTPELAFAWENEKAAPNGGVYYHERTAKIVITERPSGFDANSITLFYNEEEIPEGVANYVQIIAKDLAGNKVANDALTSLTWDPQVDTEDPDKTTYTATIPLNVDANYTIEAAYTDVAGNEGESIKTKFVIDNGPPTGTVSATLLLDESGEQVSGSVSWRELLKQEDITFALASRFGINVSKTAEDAISEIQSVAYYRFDCAEKDNVLPTISEVTDWTLWEEDAPLEYTSENNVNMRFVLYLKITDMAGNVSYISTNGLVVDDEKPAGPEGSDASAPQGAITLPADKTFEQVHPEAVTLNISINDPMIGNKKIFSGLKNVSYTIEARDLSAAEGEGHMIEKGVILEDGQLKLRGLWETTTNTGLVQTITGSILVSEEFNSNNVLITVQAEDNAGNVNVFNASLKIDTTNPTIEVMYDNNNAKGNEYHGVKFFDAGRTATIIVTERNFDAKDFSFVYMKDGEPITVTSDDLYWMEPLNVAVGNGDTTYRVASYEFMEDADYLLGEYSDILYGEQGEITAPYFAFSDMAGNPYCYDAPSEDGGEPVKVGVSFQGVATTDFAVDTKNPEIKVSYDNNDVANEKYFKAQREATITITEHNFPFSAEGVVDTDLIEIALTADRGGKVPSVKWKHNGDVHTATISYEADGDYTFEFAMADLAGRSDDKLDYGKSKAANDFVIDTTYEDMISQEGVENGVAYGYDAQVVPSIRIHDINLDEYTVTLTGVQKDKVIDLTDEVNALLKKSTETVTGVFDIFQVVQDKDAIYTLKLYSLDKAGNEDSMEIVFTVNRFGSVYVFDDYLLELIKDGGAFVQKVENDLIITEYNADKLVADSLKIEITVDGKPLENVEYTVTPEINDMVAVGSSGWYQYKYTISKDNFSTDGVYKISISSEDATGNKPENTNYEDLGILFRVDSTRADISSIVGLEKPIINAQAVTVKYTVFDTIGIKSIMVYVDGKVVDEITDFSADPNNYAGSFTVAEKNVQQAVRLVVEDMAGNITDTDAGEFAPVYDFNGKVTVSTNIFVRWYANKGLFWGSIGGVALAAGAVWFLLAKKKKKETV